jgi:tetratricopeptide (TPR) repeat protein
MESWVSRLIAEKHVKSRFYFALVIACASLISSTVSATAQQTPYTPAELKKLEVLAEKYSPRKKAPQLLRLAENVLKRNPDNPEFLVHRGEAKLSLRMRDQAVADFTEAIRIKPDCEYYRKRGYAYKVLGYYKKSLADYQTAARISGRASHLVNVAEIQIEVGDLAACIKECKKAITMLNTEKDPEDRAYVERLAHQTLGVAYLGSQQYTQAAFHLNKVLEIAVACESKKQGKPIQLKDLARTYSSSILRRGEAYEKSGKLKEAIRDYELIDSAAPKHFQYKKSLLRAYRSADMNEKALALVNELLQLDDSPDLYYKRAEIYKKLGKDDLAKVDFDRARKREDMFMGSRKE